MWAVTEQVISQKLLMCVCLYFCAFQSLSPKLCEILQARLKDRRGALTSSRASARALHLEPEFNKTPHNNPNTLEHNTELQHFLETEEREEKSQNHTQATPTPQDTNGHTNTEVKTKMIKPQLETLDQGFMNFRFSQVLVLESLH